MTTSTTMTTSTAARIFNVKVEAFTHTSVDHICGICLSGIMTGKRAERLSSALFHTFGRDPEESVCYVSRYHSSEECKCRELNIVLWSVDEIVRFKKALRAVGIESLDDGDGVSVTHQYFGVYAPKEERTLVVLSPVDEW